MESILEFKSGKIKSKAECFDVVAKSVYNVLLNSLLLAFKNKFISFAEINVDCLDKNKIVNNSHFTKYHKIKPSLNFKKIIVSIAKKGV